MQSFYERCKATVDTDESFTSVFGEKGLYEAVVRIVCTDGCWYGYLVFKDLRLSPIEDNRTGIQFSYYTPAAANGWLAEIRAKKQWEGLVMVFKHL